MKILVPTKRVVNPDEPIRVRPDGLGVDSALLGHVINPFDAIALEEALQIRERVTSACEVTAVSIGDEACEQELRMAMAMGADRAIRIAVTESPDPYNVARLLAAIVAREHPDLVLMGKQAIDDDAGQAGQMLAALLDWPQATCAARVEVMPDKLRIARETDVGLETVIIPRPAVVTTDLRLNQPRYASIPAMLKARKRVIQTVTPADLGLAVAPRVRIVRLEQSSVERKCVLVTDVADLVQRLRYEAKVL